MPTAENKKTKGISINRRDSREKPRLQYCKNAINKIIVFCKNAILSEKPETLPLLAQEKQGCREERNKAFEIRSQAA
jgi:hypothetical protein